MPCSWIPWSPKLYFVDTGLLCYLLQIRNAEELATHVASTFFKGLRYWQSIAPDPFPGVLAYGGDESYRREGTAVASWRHWW